MTCHKDKTQRILSNSPRDNSKAADHIDLYDFHLCDLVNSKTFDGGVTQSREATMFRIIEYCK